MLPFTKRPSRRPAPDASQSIHTGDIEIVRGTASRYPAPPKDRPRVFQRSVSVSDADEDKTLLMPSKLRATIAPPKPSSAPPPMQSMRAVPAPSLKGLVKPRVDEERTMLRPSVMPAAHAAPSRAPSPAMMPTPYMPFKPPSAAPAKKPSAAPPVNAKGGTDAKPGKKESDAKLEVPAAVITQRTRILPRKPTLSWAAALVALGVFTGLVTAVVARGDADSLLDATASIVDPAAPRPAVATPGAAQRPVAVPASTALPPGAATACGADAPSAPAPVAQAPVNTPPKAEPVAAAVPSAPHTAKPEPPKPPPVAWAAPRPVQAPVAPKPVAAPAPPPPQAVAAAPKPAPKPAPAAPAPKGGGSEMENASAADALAKAQLEASLR